MARVAEGERLYNARHDIRERHVAKEAMKTHCVHGHEYTPENTLWRRQINGNPTRRCKTCVATEKKDWKKKAGLKKSLTHKSHRFRLTRSDLRRLVDVVWNEATESTAVPSTNWADRLIDKALSQTNGERQ